jgi:hypothetical protein
MIHGQKNIKVIHLLSDGDALCQAFSRLRLTAVARVQYQASVRYLWWTNRRRDRFFSAYLVFPSNVPSIGYSFNCHPRLKAPIDSVVR